jgi:hypothetical protein
MAAEPPPFVLERIEGLARRVRHPMIVKRVWMRQLTEAERQRVAVSDEIGPDIISIWAELKQVDRHQAVIYLARTNNLLYASDAEDLLQDLGFSGDSDRLPQARVKPSYKEGKLLYDSQVIRTVLRKTNRTKPELLLEAFERADWPSEIDNPFAAEAAEYLHNAVRETNKKLRDIRFSSAGGAVKVRWDPIELTAD